MDKPQHKQPLPIQNTDPIAKVERQVDLTVKSREKTTVCIDLEAGAALILSVKQLDADGKPLSLERKNFINPIANPLPIRYARPCALAQNIAFWTITSLSDYFPRLASADIAPMPKVWPP